MNWQVFWVTFGTIFLAEMGDKTQLAALSMTAETRAPLAVLAGACSALFLATILGVTLGGLLTQWVPEAYLKKAAGLAFILIGGLILWGKW
ncbi:MAG: TMEM165/GDT1 family protein [Thermodesulfobacteriota bacterium]